MSIEEFIYKVNEYGAKAVPFLFIVDFELKKPILLRRDEIDPDKILFEVPSASNERRVTNTTVPILGKSPMTLSAYKRKFDVVSDHLNYGDSFLTNLTIKTEIESGHDLRELFHLAKAKYKLFYRNEFLVFSPETFVRIVEGKIYTFPMKGTLDASLPDARQVLLNDAKELAEHVTIVDLMRNDLSRVASHVEVSRFRYVEEIKTSHKNLLQASSEIVGRLPDDFRSRLGTILVNLLPAGSITGAPKEKTIEVIRKAEGEKRGYYTGVFGYFDGSTLDSAVMIRFIESVEGRFFYRSGGGITTQSEANVEYQEAIDKIYVPVD